MYFERKIFSQLTGQLPFREMVVLTGMRRTGKTTLLKMVFDTIESENKVFIDLDNILDQKIFEENDFNSIWSNLKSFGINKEEKAYIFIDEIQSKPEIVKTLKYLYDHYDVKFYLSGSSSFYLKNLFSESLSGRKVIFELFPLDFEEYLIFKQKHFPFPKTFMEKEKSRNYIVFEKFKKEYDEFLNFGGFPQIVLENDEQQKRRVLKDIFNAFFEQDVKTLADFSQINVLRDLILLLFQRIGSKLDISKLASSLNTSRPTIYSYLSFLEKTYFVSFITPYSKNVDREVSGTRKVYACDSGFVNLFAKVDAGNLLENAVYNCVRHYGKVHYYQKRSGGEIDFILPELNVALEVKTKAIHQDIDKLKNLSQKIGINESYVVSKDFVDLRNIISAVNL
ncbi:MAG: ATP-binding protein [Bacteroidales bacterium]|nr:ATP-binding protein [Bacteroidales bacterium]